MPGRERSPSGWPAQAIRCSRRSRNSILPRTNGATCAINELGTPARADDLDPLPSTAAAYGLRLGQLAHLILRKRADLPDRE